MTPAYPLSPLQRLAAKWRVFGLLAVAFARLLRRYEEGHVHGTYEQAVQLELCVRTAQVRLLYELSETLSVHPPQTEAEDAALAQLRSLAVYLLALTCVIANIRARVLGAACWMRLRQERSETTEIVRLKGQSCAAPPFLDSG